MPIMAPNRYADAADLIVSLPQLLPAKRSALGITVKTHAAQIGIASTTLVNFEAGSNPTQATVLAVLRWISNH